MSDSQRLIEAIHHYQNNLERYQKKNEEAKMLHCIGRLNSLPIEVSHLEETGVGRTVNSMRKIDSPVGDAARSLVNKWKSMVSQLEETNTEESEQKSNHEDENENTSRKRKKYGSSSEDEDEKSYIKPKESKKRKKSESSDCENEYSSSEDKLSNGHKNKDDYKSSSHKKERERRKESEREARKALEKEAKREAEREARKEAEREARKEAEREARKEAERVARKEAEAKKEAEREARKEAERQAKKEAEKEAKRKQEKERELRKEAERQAKKEAEKEAKRKLEKEAEKEERRRKEKEAKKRSKDSKSSDDKYSDKKERKSDNGHKSRSESKHSKDRKSRKYNSEEDESSEDRKKSSDEEVSRNKSKDRKSSKYDSDDGGSKNEKHKKADKKCDQPSSSKSKSSSKIKLIDDCGIDSASGASFAEALGMFVPVPTTSTKRKSSTISTPPTEKIREDRSTKSKSTEPSLLQSNFKLEPLDLNISSLLPTISTNYKPLNNITDLESYSKVKPNPLDDEALTKLMYAKNQRTKVYSGNKSVWGKIPSLFEMCTRVLQDNIDALEYTGGVPYGILKPVLEKATPDQLFTLEHHNPYLIEDTDNLWYLHCQKEFRNKKREELESWREMYMRCLDEREAKLKALTANIKLSQDKSIPVRQTKLAYVDSVVKPPRNIARKQVKNGISAKPSVTPSSRLSTLALANGADQVVVPSPVRVSSGSSSAIKPKKAPLMQKTLQLLKGRFRR